MEELRKWGMCLSQLWAVQDSPKFQGASGGGAELRAEDLHGLHVGGIGGNGKLDKLAAGQGSVA